MIARKKRPLLVVCLSLVLCVGVVGIAGLLYLILSVHAEMQDKPFNRAASQAIVAQIQAGKLKPDSRGVVSLPPALADTTTTGTVSVTKKRDGLVLIYFPLRGQRMGPRGYLHISRPLEGKDFKKTSSGVRGIEMHSELGGGAEIVPLSKQVSAEWWSVYSPVINS